MKRTPWAWWIGIALSALTLGAALLSCVWTPYDPGALEIGRAHV